MKYSKSRLEMLEILADLVVDSHYHGDQEQDLLNYVSELEEVENHKSSVFGALSPLLEEQE